MNKLFPILLISIIAFSSCRIQAPEFRRVENARYDTNLQSGLKVGADLVLYNPNFGRLKLKTYSAEIYADGKKIASLNENCSISIKPRKEFSIPVNATLKPEKNLMEGLKGLFKEVTKKEIDLRITGKVELRSLFYKKSVNIDVNQKIKLD